MFHEMTPFYAILIIARITERLVTPRTRWRSPIDLVISFLYSVSLMALSKIHCILK